MYNVNSIHVLMKWFSFNISHHLLVHKNSATKTQLRGFKMNQMFGSLVIVFQNQAQKSVFFQGAVLVNLIVYSVKIQRTKF